MQQPGMLGPPKAAMPADMPAEGLASDKPVQEEGQGQITAERVRSEMTLTPKQAQQLDRIVMAGRKVMFSEQSHKLMREQVIDNPAPMPEKLGMGAAGLVALLLNEAKGALPGELLIPAGLILLVHAAEFIREAGQPVTDADIAAGMGVMIDAVLKVVGVDPEKVKAMGGPGALKEGEGIAEGAIPAGGPTVGPTATPAGPPASGAMPGMLGPRRPV